MTCCCKFICNGCDFANKMREKEGRLEHKCPYCRHTLPKLHELQDEYRRTILKRLEANNQVAISEMGLMCAMEGDFRSAVEYWTKAAALGDVRAHYHLSQMYRSGQGVEMDKKKEILHLEEAAIGGQPNARYILGVYEGENGRRDKSMKHFVIAANMGHDESLQMLKQNYSNGLVSKDDLASALRAHQAAVDATKSTQRDKAEAAWQQFDSKKAAARQN